MASKSYPMSFTTGGLFRFESIILAELYLETGDWDRVRKRVMADNLLQARTRSSLTRNTNEIIRRLITLSEDELSYLVTAAEREQGYLLWVAVCRTYPFIADFARDVLREKFLGSSGELNKHDFESFYNNKADWHPGLETITESSRYKLRFVLFKIMREADLLSSKNVILGALPDPEFIRILMANSPGDILFFPVSDADVKHMTS